MLVTTVVETDSIPFQCTLIFHSIHQTKIGHTNRTQRVVQIRNRKKANK